MNVCYILFSPSLGKFYTGITKDSLESRLLNHQAKTYGNHRFTATTDDWELFLKIEANSYAHARRMELKIKKMKSSKFIKSLKANPDLLSKLIQETY